MRMTIQGLQAQFDVLKSRKDHLWYRILKIDEKMNHIEEKINELKKKSEGKK